MSNNNPILKIGQEVLFVIGLYQKMILKLNLFLTIVKICLGGHLGGSNKKLQKKTPHAERHISDLGEIRTHDPRFRRPLLYPAELPNQFLNRTYSSIGKRKLDVNYFLKKFI